MNKYNDRKSAIRRELEKQGASESTIRKREELAVEYVAIILYGAAKLVSACDEDTINDLFDAENS